MKEGLPENKSRNVERMESEVIHEKKEKEMGLKSALHHHVPVSFLGGFGGTSY